MIKPAPAGGFAQREFKRNIHPNYREKLIDFLSRLQY